MKRHLRARVRAAQLLPLEPIELPEGSEVDLTLDLPEPPKKLPTVAFPTWNLGLGSRPITREDAYGDEW